MQAMNSSAFLDFATISDGDIDVSPLTRLLPSMIFHPTTSAAQLAQRLAQPEVVLLNKIVMGAAHFKQAPKLRLICAAATGTDNIDLEAAGQHGVAVCNIRGYCTDSVVQHVFSLILALSQHLAGYQRLLRDGAWRGSPQFCLLDYPIYELRGKTLGIVGHGELGSGVARLGAAFGMKVLLAQRPGGPARDGRVSLDQLLPEVDILSLHCPLREETRHLIGADQLRAMKKTALLINTARGALVDARALADALRSGQLGGAGIDVLEQEPPVDGNPLLDDDIPNLIVTPHIAWAAREARQRAIDEMAANIESWQQGGDRNRIV